MALYAEPSTPLRPPSAPNIAFTSPQEPESPQNLHLPAAKRPRGIKMDIQLPPRLDLGSSQLNNNSVASTIGGHIAAIERDAKQKRDMVLAFAHSVDSFVASYTTAKERKLASELSQKVVTFLSASIYAETDSAAPAPAHPRGNPSADIPASTTKTVTYADRARSNAGLSSSTDPRKSRNSTTLLNRPEPFILRQSLAKQIDGLTLASIPSITPTATGWAINPSDIATRDILLTQENAEVTKRTLSAYSLEIPVTWFNYAVTNVPTGFHNLIGGMTLTDASLVSEEALAQTHQHPSSIRRPPSPDTIPDARASATRRAAPATRAAPTAASDWTSTLAPPDPTVRTPHSARIATDPLMPTMLAALRTGAPVIAPPKRKRGAAVTAHENAGQRAPKPDCAPRAVNSTILPPAPPNPRNGSQMLSSPMPESDPPSDSDESMAEDEDELATLAPSIGWANVGKSASAHMTLLATSFIQELDVICAQEPWTSTNSRTQNHPGYDCYSPVDSWIYDTPKDRESARPRVMTYIRKGAGLRVQQRRPIHSRDLLWTDVNGIAILNAYRQPTTPEVLDYVTHLTPSPKCLVGGDFNAWHDMFEPGVRSTHRGADLARWSSESNMDFIGTPGEPTHNAGHVLDLTFSNIPFASTIVRKDMHTGSDHETLVTSLPNRGVQTLEQHHYRIPESQLGKFADLVHLGVSGLPDARHLSDAEGIEHFVQLFTSILDSAIRTAGKPDRGRGRAAPWWTQECQDAHREHLAARKNTPDSVNPGNQGVSQDSAEGQEGVINWHKLGTNLKAPPLVVNGNTVEGTMEKAETLWSEVLDRFSASDDLAQDPLEPWDGAGTLPCLEAGGGSHASQGGEKRQDISPLLEAHSAHFMRLQGPGKDHRPPGRLDGSDIRYPESPARRGPPQTLCYGLGSLLHTRRRASLFERTGSHHGYDGCPRSVRCAAETPATRPDEDPRVAADPPQAHRLLPHQQTGIPLSPVLYMLYLAELLSQDSNIRFGYADDICLYKASTSVDINVASLATEIRNIMHWGTRNKIAFAPEKLEMIHLTRKNGSRAPDCVVSPDLVIPPITTSPKKGDQPALRWLGVWFDRRLTFKRHVAERAGKARQIARHIRGLAKTVDGPPASALRKAVITCVIPSLTYGTEAWYAGRTKPPRLLRSGRSTTVSARVGWHIDTLDKTLSLAVRGVLPVWRTTPTVTLYRDAGIPSAEAMLEEAKLRFALRIQTVDEAHPLVLRPTLRPPHYTHGCRVDPTGGVDKETAAAAFKTWWNDLPPDDVTIFSDGSEQYHERQKYVGYGYAIYQNRKQIGSGSGSINPISHVFDAEAIGAWRGLQHTLRMPQEVRSQRLWMCIDSTSVIWCLRANASASSQWAFIACQNAMQVYNIRIKWSPGHTEIEGNEAADRLADTGAHTPDCDPGPASLPTISGIGSIFRDLRSGAQQSWWIKRKAKLSAHYLKWDLTYRVGLPPELDLPRNQLHRLLAIRSAHGDFAWYHNKFRHANALTECSCGAAKAPMHLVHCPRSHKRFKDWPSRPPIPPTSNAEGLRYLTHLLSNPMDFAKFLDVTGCYTHLPVSPSNGHNNFDLSPPPLSPPLSPPPLLLSFSSLFSPPLSPSSLPLFSSPALTQQ
ncbi:hypothetical protein DID88_001379 [Monilinia fructigena]|uniref:RNase H type-1 domain-containing protein n=1 Tax=Monilinia fructigena TaxID=38457 RepID=A0A395IWY7_9HELO|nr:hypothetical protein DID88_001379 [Monilinia fructigena]